VKNLHTKQISHNAVFVLWNLYFKENGKWEERKYYKYLKNIRYDQ